MTCPGRPISKVVNMSWPLVLMVLAFCAGDNWQPIPLAAASSARVEPPTDLECQRWENVVELTWTNPSPFDEIVIARDGEQLATLPGDSES